MTRRREAEFGQLLAALRRARGLTQADLSARLDVHRTTLSAWERGIWQPPITMLGPLCRALGVRPDVFVDLPRRGLERYLVD